MGEEDGGGDFGGFGDLLGEGDVGVGVGDATRENVGKGEGDPVADGLPGDAEGEAVALTDVGAPAGGVLAAGGLLWLALAVPVVGVRLGLVATPVAALLDRVAATDGAGECCPVAVGDRNARNCVRPSAASASSRTPPVATATITRRRPLSLPGPGSPRR